MLKPLFHFFSWVNLLVLFCLPSFSQAKFFLDKPLELKCSFSALPKPLLILLEPSRESSQEGRIVNLRNGLVVYDQLNILDGFYSGMFWRAGTNDSHITSGFLGVEVSGSAMGIMISRLNGNADIGYANIDGKVGRIYGKCETYKSKRLF
jgi:hypothetical protein